MSVKIRKQIETILRETSSVDRQTLLQSLDLDNLNLENEQDMDFENTNSNPCQTYTIQRLIHEGFTKNQAMTAYSTTKNSLSRFQIQDEVDEGSWDDTYEQCLQWLCIHLEEDQLPLGFDPRGSTLDVVMPLQDGKKMDMHQILHRQTSAGSLEISLKDSDRIQNIMTTYGTSLQVAQYLSQGQDPHVLYWDAFTHITSMTHLSSATLDPFWKTMNQMEKSSNVQSAEEELEALSAIFQDDMSLSRSQKDDGVVVTVMIHLPSQTMRERKSLHIQFRQGLYPSKTPTVVIQGGWEHQDHVRASLIHFELIKFLGQQASGDPILYAIYTFVMDVMETTKDSVHDKYDVQDRLLQFFRRGTDTLIQQDKQNHREKNDTMELGHISDHSTDQQPTSKIRQKTRPSTKNDFWSTSGKQVAPAVAFPKISTLITKTREGLPAANAKNEFLSKLNESEKLNRVVLVTGETGCGKTTQIPQFILEDNPSAKILVTQPRRLAAIGVSSRVAEERGEAKPGEGSVGYVVRGESAISNKCRLLFCTTGVLLRQLQNENALDCITHIVVDEVHERSLDCDVLLAILKEYLPTATHLHVILMSGTFVCNYSFPHGVVFSTYFPWDKLQRLWMQIDLLLTGEKIHQDCK
jgi:hypothetical protein